MSKYTKSTKSTLAFAPVTQGVYECVDRGNTFVIRRIDHGYSLTKSDERMRVIFHSEYATLSEAKAAAWKRRYEWTSDRVLLAVP